MGDPSGMQRLSDRVAIITGAGSVVSRASARLFAAQGAKVLVTGRRLETVAPVAGEICDRGGEALALQVDVGVESDIKAMVDVAMARFGRIDVLFNNAVNSNPDTAARDGDFLNFDVGAFNDNMRINVLGGVLACKYALPHMLARGQGSIIFTSSSSSLQGEVSMFSYGASKAALNWYVKTLAATYGRQGIRCNGIVPGVILTESLQAWWNPAMEAAFLDLQNVPRLGRPEDIAQMALFLASDESAYCNGSLYEVNGGMMCATPMVPVVRRFFS